MKKFVVVLTLPVMLLLCGCPVGLDFAPGVPGSEKIDKDMIGAWEAETENDVFKKVQISRKDDFSFHVKVAELGSMYALDASETEFTGWNTVIDKQPIFYVKSSENKYYCYGYKVDAKAGILTYYDVSLLVGGTDAVTSTNALRKEISESLKNPDWYKEPSVFKKN